MSDKIGTLRSFVSPLLGTEALTCLSPRARLLIQNARIHAFDNHGNTVIEPYLASILETFVHHHELKRARRSYQRLQRLTPFHLLMGMLERRIKALSGDIALTCIGSRILVSVPALGDRLYQLGNYLNINNITKRDDFAMVLRRFALDDFCVIDLTELSAEAPVVLLGLAESRGVDCTMLPRLNAEEFLAVTKRFCSMGLLTIPVGKIRFGDFREYAPFCNNYGFTRGTPIDRYYLDQFIAEIRDEVNGDTLEIGGRKENRHRYGLRHVISYKVIDVIGGRSVDIVADAHDVTACSANSFDSILLFNVLEHCERPWVIASNLSTWLRPGGKVYCMVPVVQRIHGDPKDYWRILPDSLEFLFRDYHILKKGTYGNLMTSVAALSGIAMEELDLDELSPKNPQYPVISWIVAKKGK